MMLTMRNIINAIITLWFPFRESIIIGNDLFDNIKQTTKIKKCDK